jgi:hypothetical protein
MICLSCRGAAGGKVGGKKSSKAKTKANKENAKRRWMLNAARSRG